MISTLLRMCVDSHRQTDFRSCFQEYRMTNVLKLLLNCVNHHVIRELKSSFLFSRSTLVCLKSEKHGVESCTNVCIDFPPFPSIFQDIPAIGYFGTCLIAVSFLFSQTFFHPNEKRGQLVLTLTHVRQHQND